MTRLQEGAQRSPAAAFLLLLAAYFAIQALIRVFIAPSAGLDEAEILITAQSAAWGHGTQPPLYNFLQIAGFQIFGTNVLALALVKNLFLFAIFAFVYLGARIVLPDEAEARLAALAMFTIPQIAWESQRALTHTVAVLAMAALTFFVLVRVLRDGRWLDYVALGLCLGLGALSKYNFGIGALAMIVAAGTVRELRPRVLSWRMLASLAIAALVILPHALWVSGHLEDALARTHKFQAKSEAAYTLAPSLAVLSGSLQYAVLPLALFAICLGIARLWPPTPSVSARQRTPLQSFALRIIPVGLAMLAIGAIPAGITEFKDRWMSPLLFLLPLAVIVLLGHRLQRGGAKTLQYVSVLLALVSMAALAALHLWTREGREPAEANAPMPALAESIRQQGFTRGTIIGGSTTLAGQLKLEFADSPVVEPQYGLLIKPDIGQPVLLAWQGENALPADMGELFRDICGAPSPATAPRHVAAEYPNGMIYGLNFVVLRGCEAIPG
ncbi:glycosyltransferase family 39 protein [Terrihabitans rhizophilus]|uniref:Glycosyltransferase family 39 protein n=1 Tax=Terrihabitans rhizophilus TaxID=3092662 RepID=A0ABU4RK25_9HYPH|nr:glycosyltransferase family 39 protein [Terrihabitans sp. PJ23]MDX6805191.1 glycosyltransferase family 39 protein [Terrihabitans sp. PJ23]